MIAFHKSISVTLVIFFVLASGCTDTGHQVGKVRVSNLPAPEAPSRVLGIGQAMESGKPVMLIRPLGSKYRPTPDDERNLYFLEGFFDCCKNEVKIIELHRSGK